MDSREAETMAPGEQRCSGRTCLHSVRLLDRLQTRILHDEMGRYSGYLGRNGVVCIQIRHVCCEDISVSYLMFVEV